MIVKKAVPLHQIKKISINSLKFSFMKTLKEIKSLVNVSFDSKRHEFSVTLRCPDKVYSWFVTLESSEELWKACCRLDSVLMRCYSPTKVFYNYNERQALVVLLSYFDKMDLWEK